MRVIFDVTLIYAVNKIIMLSRKLQKNMARINKMKVHPDNSSSLSPTKDHCINSFPHKV